MLHSQNLNISATATLSWKKKSSKMIRICTRVSICVCVVKCVRPLGVVDGASSQDDSYSRCAAVQVVNTQSFFICGSTDYKHQDVLRPETDAQVWIMWLAVSISLWWHSAGVTCLWGCWLPGMGTDCLWVDLWSAGPECREEEADAECTHSPHPEHTHRNSVL